MKSLPLFWMARARHELGWSQNSYCFHIKGELYKINREGLVEG